MPRHYREWIPMQNSLWKLISIVGVIAIGSLVVKEVHDGLSFGGAAVSQADDTSGTEGNEIQITTDTEPSEFENQLSAYTAGDHRPDPEAPAYDESFREILDEPDPDALESVNTGFDLANLTDNRDPFAVNSQTPVPDPDVISSDTRPAQTVSFMEEAESGETAESDLFGFSAPQAKMLSIFCF